MLISISWRLLWLRFAACILFGTMGNEDPFAKLTTTNLWPGQALSDKAIGVRAGTFSVNKVDLERRVKRCKFQVRVDPLFDEIVTAVCRHMCLIEGRSHIEASLRWQSATSSLIEAEAKLKQLLVRYLTPSGAPPMSFNAIPPKLLGLTRWIEELGLEFDSFEAQALVALTKEALYWWQVVVDPRDLDDGGLEYLLDMVCELVAFWTKSGRFGEARRVFEAFEDFEFVPGYFPVSHFYDSGDYRIVGAGPEPGLRVLPIPISFEDAPQSGQHNELLPSDLVRNLRSKLPLIAKEAKSAISLLNEKDAYSSIARGRQWTKIDLYTAQYGWSNDVCNKHFQILCNLLRTRMRSEHVMKKWRKEGRIKQGQPEQAKNIHHNMYSPGNEEMVGVFGVSAGGWAPIHSGFARRINIHLCLSGCNNSRAIVAGKQLPYHDGSLFAFEDRASHEIINDADPGSEDRLNLVIAVWHPDYDADKSWRGHKKKRVRSAIKKSRRLRVAAREKSANVQPSRNAIEL